MVALHETLLELLIYEVEVHEVRDAIEYCSVVDQDVAHPQFYFGDGVWDDDEDLVQLDHDYFCLLKDLIVHVQLHFLLIQIDDLAVLGTHVAVNVIILVVVILVVLAFVIGLLLVLNEMHQFGVPLIFVSFIHLNTYS